ncbi:hypothetical protein BDN72DRAFT_965077 [Pluteus cervinus]|uniref:Uncharacterized protein n=1 Tax=Pluteus cervinus TaxID=181527 RepID=A0ACD3A7I2_9AGAR|nr:hypothetical protein BDN72DRAFT_965077 [Pluteus cervinus]
MLLPSTVRSSSSFFTDFKIPISSRELSVRHVAKFKLPPMHAAQFALFILLSLFTVYQLFYLLKDLFQPKKKRRSVMLPLVLTVFIMLASYLLNAIFLGSVFSQPNPIGSTLLATPANALSILSDVFIIFTLVHFLWEDIMDRNYLVWIFIQYPPWIASIVLLIRSGQQEWLVSGGVSLGTGLSPDPTGARHFYVWYMAHWFALVVLLLVAMIGCLPQETHTALTSIAGYLLLLMIYESVQFGRVKPPMHVDILNRWFLADIIFRGLLRARIVSRYSRGCAPLPPAYG